MHDCWNWPMRSLILTILYLAKDTVHRWFSRVSSPLARVLVVYFLTLSALAALGGFIISINVVRNNIIQRGANIVTASLYTHDGASYIPTEKELDEMLDADSYVFRHLGPASIVGGRSVTVYTCDFSRVGALAPFLAPGGGPTLLKGESDTRFLPGPGNAVINGEEVDISVRSVPDNHPIMRLFQGAALFVLPEDAERIRERSPETEYAHHILAISVRHLESSEQVRRVVNFLQKFSDLDDLQGRIVSALFYLEEMDEVLSHQTECRIVFCLGISIIVGILLTALAGMEYRQNEYIYTLMKSFGIHPLLLVGSFIVENIIIVGGSFAGAIATFMYFQRIIVTQILKLGDYTISLQEIMPEILLISYTLLGCVLISSIPIFAAANRRIGRVLK